MMCMMAILYPPVGIDVYPISGMHADDHFQARRLWVMPGQSFLPQPQVEVLKEYPRAILHDEDLFPEPEEYRPERFIKQEGMALPPDPVTLGAFGFGRRYVFIAYQEDATTYVW